MLKKTLLATAAIGATLLAAAAVLPALAQSRSVASASSAALVAQSPVDAAMQDSRDAADNSRTRKAEHREDLNKGTVSDHEGHSVEVNAIARTDRAQLSAFKTDNTAKRGDEVRGNAGGNDQDKSRD